MTRIELIKAVAARAGVPRATAERVVTLVFQSLTDALARGQGVEIRGFGSFKVRSYKGYRGRNPRTREPIEVPPKRLPVFRTSKEIRVRLLDDSADRADSARP
jgi:integration host factor subunit beta